MTPRLHVEPARLAHDTVVVIDEDQRYLTRVLRLGAGERLVLFDGLGGEADAEIVRVGPRAVELRVTARRPAPPRRGPEMVLLQGLARGDKLDLVVQKATELGVHRVVPVLTERAVARPGLESVDARRARWRRIAVEAARQCGRADLPEVDPVTPFAVAVGAQPAEALRLIFWEEARSRRLRDLLPAAAPPTVVLAVGPEGGFTEEEVGIARGAGFLVAGLGPRTLRTETAGLAALAVVGYALGSW